MIALLALAVPLALYVSIPSCFWNFDGVACAAALELGSPFYFFHANHLLYGWLGFLFWKFIGFPLGLSRALPALQLFTSLLSALGLVGLHRLVLPIVKERWTAFLLALGLGVSAAFWVWSIEAQVYALAFLALAWAAYALVQNEGPNTSAWVGLLHGGAVLGHLMHGLWIVPALYWMWGKPNEIRRYLYVLAATIVFPYLLVVGCVIAPGRDWTRILIWLKGSAGLTPDRSWAWHSGGLLGPWLWLKSTAPMLWGGFWPYGSTKVLPWMWGLTALSFAILTVLVWRGGIAKPSRLSRFSWLWLGVYGLFLSTWEPQTLCYRMTDILPLGILLALGLSSFGRSAQFALTAMLLLSLLPLNLATRIAPMHRAEQNLVYEDTLSLSKITPPNSLYITEGGLSWMYLLYFTGRTAWNARNFEPARLIEEIHRQKGSRPVYVQKGSSWQLIP